MAEVQGKWEKMLEALQKIADDPNETRERRRKASNALKMAYVDTKKEK